jgi:AraC family transcriptional regulator of adaptative response/methylated-DNA-[protein]-cysteine methyltransferase
MMNQQDCWTAVVERERAQDGKFFYGVLTTGVFCRPSCPSRVPHRKNVRFYETAADAARDGLRPCRRCHPLDDDPRLARIHELCDYIRAHTDESLSLDALSRRVGLSRFHFQRLFTSAVGVTPKAFVAGCRLARFKGELRTGPSVTAAIYEAGFGSSSRVYERVDTSLGMTPAEYRAGGKGVSISFAALALGVPPAARTDAAPSPRLSRISARDGRGRSTETGLGVMMIGATDRGVCFVQFGESEVQLLAMLGKEYPSATLEAMRPSHSSQFRSWMQAVKAHLDGHQPSPELPLDIRATAFQLKVWRYLQSIPAGDVQSYAEVAKGIGQPGAARAVARACASNRVAIVIPCHRVVRGDGALGGYRWGVARKRVLLDRERAARARSSVVRG